jgi:hypothetical protein
MIVAIHSRRRPAAYQTHTCAVPSECELRSGSDTYIIEELPRERGLAIKYPVVVRNSAR